MSIKLGTSWNESSVFNDPITLRKITRLTSFGAYNQMPTYHTNTAFSADGKCLVFASARGEKSYIIKAEIETGELSILYEAEGVGSRDYMHQSSQEELGNGRGVSGNRLALAPKTGWAIFSHNRALKAVNIYSYEQRTLIKDITEEWTFGAPSPSPDEKHVVVPLSTAHPQILNGKLVTRSYLSYPNHSMRLLRVSMTGTTCEELYRETPCNCAHSSYCPTDNDLVYFDRNVPPSYCCGNDGGKTPRIWLIRLSTGKIWPLRTEYPGVFQVHAAWTWDGEAIVYHGFLKPSGYNSGIYIGITSKDGTPIRDYVFPDVTDYGHVNPDPKRPAIILDGDLAPGHLTWLYYDNEKPRLEIICKHDTEWESLPGQYSHPHAQSDPTGRWISFNKAHGGRSDVYVVEV
ncbi:MAG: hypothetical protein KAS17_04560 [Victivallaceae bacterium]|nr:hypothetical protein [Victivallaceae bacterium]